MQARRHTPVALAASAAALALAPLAARADITSTFNFIATDISVNNDKSFALPAPAPNSTGPLVLDPTNPDVLYVFNRAASGTTDGTAGGAYPYSLSTHNRITNPSGTPIFLSTNVSGLRSWTGTADPYAGLVTTDGTLWLVNNAATSLQKVSNPLSDSPSATRILTNYSNTTLDDDPAFLAQIPASFIANNPNLTGYSTNDLLMLDTSIDDSNEPAIVAIHADGSDALNPKVLYQRPTPIAATSRGGIDAKNGFFYFMQVNPGPDVTTIGGNSVPTLYRVASNGTVQSVGLNLPAGASLGTLDDAIAVNPADGSVWVANIDSGSNRTVYRIDAARAAGQGNDQFLAAVTTEFTATGFNLGVNSLTFSPDGKTLYAGTPDGDNANATTGNMDKIWAFDVTPALARLPGDANDDGKVDADDFALTDRGFAKHLTTWADGDFNYDGKVDSADYLIIDAAFAQAHGGTLSPSTLAARASQFGDAYVASLIAAVPEPASLAPIAAASVSLLTRRRNRRHAR